MNAWVTLWEHRGEFLIGLENTLILFLGSVFLAILIGIASVYLTEGRKTWWKIAWRWLVDIMRTLPFLIFAYLLYYGLPAVHIRLSAWTSGLIALTVYHGAYFAEIFRGARSTLPRGQIDAAKANGYRRFGMVTRIVLPQIFLRSSPILANQLVYLLKDTAFLTIITVQELTGKASAIQATYFIPVQAFIVAIFIYWILTLITDAIVRNLEHMAIKRGIGNVQTKQRR